MPTRKPSVPVSFPPPCPPGLLTSLCSTHSGFPVWHSRPFMCGLHWVCYQGRLHCDVWPQLTTQCCLPRVPQTSQAAGPQTPPWFPPSLVLLMLFPLPGMLFPPVYGNPTPHSSFKGSAQKAHSPRSCLPSPLCKCGINCIFLLTSVALSPLSPPRPLDHSHSEVCLLWQVIRSLWRS